PQRRAALPAGLERERAPRLHRDDPPVAPALRRAESAQVPAQAPPRPALALQRGLPARVHLGCQRQQRLLRARAARPPPPRLRARGLTATRLRPRRRPAGPRSSSADPDRS